MTPSGSQTAKTLNWSIRRQVRLKYLLYLPEGCAKRRAKFPLVLFLHGAGERGDDLERVKVHGLPKIAAQGGDFPFIVVSPQCPANTWWSNDLLKALIDEIVKRYPIDQSRIYATGLSMGGFGTWNLACEYPDLFAAIAPICGGGTPFMASRLKDTPVWAFHGRKDNVVPVKCSKEMVDAVKRAGGDAKLTVYPKADHDSWSRTYDNPELYKWLLSHAKKKSAARS